MPLSGCLAGRLFLVWWDPNWMWKRPFCIPVGWVLQSMFVAPFSNASDQWTVFSKQWTVGKMLHIIMELAVSGLKFGLIHVFLQQAASCKLLHNLLFLPGLVGKATQGAVFGHLGCGLGCGLWVSWHLGFWLPKCSDLWEDDVSGISWVWITELPLFCTIIV